MPWKRGWKARSVAGRRRRSPIFSNRSTTARNIGIWWNAIVDLLEPDWLESAVPWLCGRREATTRIGTATTIKSVDERVCRKNITFIQKQRLSIWTSSSNSGLSGGTTASTAVDVRRSVSMRPIKGAKRIRERWQSPNTVVCRNCFRCIQECPRGALEKSLDKDFLNMGGTFWKPDMFITLWKQAEDGAVPVTGAGYRGPFTGPGFDSMWTDMSEIVRPTQGRYPWTGIYQHLSRPGAKAQPSDLRGKGRTAVEGS